MKVTPSSGNVFADLGWPNPEEQGKAGISRVLYVTAVRQRVVVVRAFMKKTQKAPRHEIELALKRAREMLS